MLKLTLRPGEFIDIGENIRVIFQAVRQITFICGLMHPKKSI